MPYLTRNRFTFHALETDDGVGRGDVRRARIPDQPARGWRWADRVQAGHHPQPARAAHLRAADRVAAGARAETMIREPARHRLRRGARPAADWPAAPRRIPVHWSARVRREGNSRQAAAFDVALTGAPIDDEWHVYSVTQGAGRARADHDRRPAGAPFARARRHPRSRADDRLRSELRDQDRNLRRHRSRSWCRSARGRACDAMRALRVGVGYQACTDRSVPPAAHGDPERQGAT